MKVAAVFLSAFCAAALGIPLGQDVVHEKRDIDSLFQKGAAAEADKVIPVRIALKQQNLDKGMELLMDISEPDSPNYGKHYTQEQVAELFAPEQGSLDTVQNWLKDAGISGVSVPKSKGWVQFQTTLSKLESLLQTSYHIYEFASTGENYFGTDSYKLPSDISNVVDFVTPGVVTSKMVSPTSSKAKHSRAVPFEPIDAAMSKKLKDSKFATANCRQFVTPQCIKNLYNIPDATLKNPNNKLGMFESEDEIQVQSDLDAFFAKYAPNIPTGTGPKIDFINYYGKNPDGSKAGGEAALDFDIAYPLLYPQQIEQYQTNALFSEDKVGFLNTFLDAIDGSYCTSTSHGETGDNPDIDGTWANEACGTFKPTNVISLSYGLADSNYPANYLLRQCDEFMKLGLQGVSVFAASGDAGVAGGQGGECLGSRSDIFNGVAPAACPYVTSVGATKIYTGSTQQSAPDRFGSGGGFSNVWTAPDYQKATVDDFLAKHDQNFKSFNTSNNVIPKNGGIYNRAGRGYPDISAIGDFGVTIRNGVEGRTGGTSMSSPVIASLFNRINDERLAAGKKVLGFVNPAIYKKPDLWTDITIGDQNGAGKGVCNGRGWKAVTGWDPVTGFGTPDWPTLLEYFKNL